MEPSTEGPLYLIAVIRPRTECADEVHAQLEEMVAATRLEEGNVFMELVVSDDDPDTWLMMEKFRSRESWEAHMATDHVRDGNAALADLLREPTELRFYTAR